MTREQLGQLQDLLHWLQTTQTDRTLMDVHGDVQEMDVLIETLAAVCFEAAVGHYNEGEE